MVLLFGGPEDGGEADQLSIAPLSGSETETGSDLFDKVICVVCKIF
jgi:hypothetical protein